jgi:hypothetical protein
VKKIDRFERTIYVQGRSRPDRVRSRTADVNSMRRMVSSSGRYSAV